MKKFLSLFLAMVMLLAMVTPVMAASEATVKMYAADGRTTNVPQSKVDAYRKVGWYNGPIITIYAADGRTKKIGANDKAAYLKVGWYDSPIITMYAADGRTKKIPSSQKGAYKKVGWYEGATMYAKDGRTITVSPLKVADYKKVGWYEGTTLYAPDGRTTKVSPFKVADYTKVGWYKEPVTTMYKEDGTTKVVKKTDVEANKKNGWYATKAEVVKTVYSMNGKKEVYKSQYQKYLDKGYNSKPLPISFLDMGSLSTCCFEKNSYDKVKLCWWVQNTSGKRINYYTVTTYFVNAVGDYAYDKYTDECSYSVKTVGPVEPGEGLLVYDEVGYIPLCRKVVVGEVKLEYADGTTEEFWCGMTAKEESLLTKWDGTLTFWK